MAKKKLKDYFSKLTKVRKSHRCRLCAEQIEKGEECCRWKSYEKHCVPMTSHAHPECYQRTLDEGWDSLDWEGCASGEMKRPQSKEESP